MNNCDCNCGCQDPARYTPIRIFNPAGLSAISYRVGTHARFKADMLAAISLQKKLAGLTTRSDTDLSIGLIDSWALVEDVLSFYQERIANEGFLRTATERRSILELARSIGYELRPGVAAGAYLAFTMDSAKGSPKKAAINIGTKVQSIPAQDEIPQIFETIEQIEAKQAWNEIRPQQSKKQDLRAGIEKGQVILDGSATKLKPGDGLLFVINGLPVAFRIAKDVDVDAKKNQTRVSFIVDSGFSSAKNNLAIASNNSGDDFVIDSETSFRKSDLEVVISKVWTESALQTQSKLKGWSVDVIVEAVNALAYGVLNDSEGIGRENGLYTFRTKAGIFGHNAPKWASLPPEQRYTYNPPGSYEKDGIDVGKVSPPYPKDWDKGWPVNKNSLGNYYDESTRLIYVDNTYSSILSNTWAVMKDSFKSSAFYVKETREDSLTEFALTGKATGLMFNVEEGMPVIGSEFKTGQESPVHGAYAFARYTTGASVPEPTENEKEIELGFDENFPPIKSTNRGAFWKLKKIINLEAFDFRKTTVYAQPEKLVLAETPLEDAVEGRELLLEKMVGGLKKGMPVAVTGELYDQPGIVKNEITFLDDIVHFQTPLLTKLYLSDGLTYKYKRDTVKINANVAEATHGETKEEAIGSGDPTQRFQEFQLKQHPLTYISAKTPAGVASTLAVSINGVKWQEAESFTDLGPSDKAFITRRSNEGITSVIFGNGSNGRLPPAGQENIRAKYRVGIGSPGNLNAEQLSILMTRPLGVRSVTNPLKSAGGADPENLDDARVNSPRTVLTLDRIVSLEDFKNFARGFAGIGKATSYVVRMNDADVVLIAVASMQGEEIDALLHDKLRGAIEAYKDPTALFTLRSFVLRSFNISAKIKVSGDREFEDVKAEVENAIKNKFSFENRDFGQGVTRSEVISVIQNVPGVDAVDLDHLYEYPLPTGKNKTVEDIIRAEGKPDFDGVVIPALLLVNKEGITIEEMQA